MHEFIPAFTLLAEQSRIINAAEGLRLEVRNGGLWLTRPGDSVDHFLVAGDTIVLHENQIQIQSDRKPASSSPASARYVLVPLHLPSVARRGRFTTAWKAVLAALKVVAQPKLNNHPARLNGNRVAISGSAVA